MCEVIEINGSKAFICGGHRRKKKKCGFCPSEYADRLCDFPVGKGKTCDAAICSACAISIAHEVDYCPMHRDKQPAQQSLF